MLLPLEDNWPLLSSCWDVEHRYDCFLSCFQLYYSHSSLFRKIICHTYMRLCKRHFDYKYAGCKIIWHMMYMCTCILTSVNLVIWSGVYYKNVISPLSSKIWNLGILSKSRSTYCKSRGSLLKLDCLHVVLLADKNPVMLFVPDVLFLFCVGGCWELEW